MRNAKRIKLAAIFSAVLLAAAGCGKVDKLKTKSASITYSENIYPISCDDTLSLWSNTMSGGEDLNSTPLGKAWQEQTGVKIDFVQPTFGSSEAFSVMIASGELPDIIVTNLYTAPGGVGKYAGDNVIVPVTDELEKNSPNLYAYLKEDPEVDKMVKSDDGQYYGYPCIIPNKAASAKLTSTAGLVVRKDMLDKAGLAVPETIDEWHTALAAFKAQGASAPLSYDLLYWEDNYGIFTGAYGTKGGFYIQDGKVKYGYMEPEFKEAVNTFRQWYAEGLIDQNIVKIADLGANIMNSQTGASCMWAGGGIGKYMRAMENKDKNFSLVAAKAPVRNKGEISQFGAKEFRYTTQNTAYITSACKNKELAMRFLDFGYTEAGHMLFNFGIEGESYVMKDGYPTYTDVILNNPDGLSITDAMNKYIFAQGSCPFIADERYIEQYYTFDQQKQALDVWSECDSYKTKMPLITFTSDESSRVSAIMNNVETCAHEMIFKFILGVEPMENYDGFVAQLKAFGVDEAIEIYEKALTRFNNR